ncbi:unnamed protein product [Symbiodinium sp. KB8]|nr:unnamed protein product [Symbiodinium sp. KB8]
MIIVFLGPSTGTLEMRPYNTDDAETLDIITRPGTLVVLRPDLLSHKHFSNGRSMAISAFFLQNERKSRANKRHDSPKKQKSAEDGVTMSALRTLLAEQSHALLQAQQVQITAALSSFEERQSTRLDKVEETIQAQGSTVAEVQRDLQALQDRLAKVEQSGVQPGGSGPDRKWTLVFGGWLPDTRRAILLHQLEGALQGVKVRDSLDADPFTTGARRSVALCQFKRRANEADPDVRQRMLHVLQVVNASKVQLEGSQKPLWAAFSKTPAERGRAALAAVVRKAVMRFGPHRQGDLDVEYTSGRSWIRDDQISGVGAPPQEVHQARIVNTKGGEGWIDEKTLSKWLEVDIAELKSLIDEHKF